VGMTTTPDEPTKDSRGTTRDTASEAERDGEDNERVATDPEPDSDSYEPSSASLDTPSSGMGDPVARGVAEDSAPSSNVADPDDDQGSARTDFADEGYDDRQLDGSRAAAEERGDIGPATTPET
jgi:hypothetical protein